MTDAVIANDDGGLSFIAELARLARNLERERDGGRADIARLLAEDHRNNQIMVGLMAQRDELMKALENYSSHSLARAAITKVKGEKP